MTDLPKATYDPISKLQQLQWPCNYSLLRWTTCSVSYLSSPSHPARTSQPLGLLPTCPSCTTLTFGSSPGLMSPPQGGDLNAVAILFNQLVGSNKMVASFCFLKEFCTVLQKFLNTAESFCHILQTLLRQQKKIVSSHATRWRPECEHLVSRTTLPCSHTKKEVIPVL